MDVIGEAKMGAQTRFSNESLKEREGQVVAEKGGRGSEGRRKLVRHASLNGFGFGAVELFSLIRARLFGRHRRGYAPPGGTADIRPGLTDARDPAAAQLWTSNQIKCEAICAAAEQDQDQKQAEAPPSWPSHTHTHTRHYSDEIRLLRM